MGVIRFGITYHSSIGTASLPDLRMTGDDPALAQQVNMLLRRFP